MFEIALRCYFVEDRLIVFLDIPPRGMKKGRQDFSLYDGPPIELRKT